MRKLRSKPFYCEPLRDNPENESLIESFTIDREDVSGPEECCGLEAYLKIFAWDDDANNKVRVYLIKDIRCQEIAAYFSLKAGMVAYQEGTAFLTNKERDKLLAKGIKSIPGAIPAIEIAHFAVNDNYRREISKGGKEIKGLGAFFYPQFIHPIIMEAADRIGVCVVYLYAAGDESLVSYYRNVFKFRTLSDSQWMTPIQPDYDTGCTFMYKPL